MHIFAIATAAVAALSSVADAKCRNKARHRQHNPSAMRMRPVSQDPFPSATSTASWFDRSLGDNAPEVATLHVKASVPSVNLENVPSLLSIDCAGTIATATFSTESSIALWDNEPTLLLIASHHKCGNDVAQQFSMLLATSWTISDDGKTVVFETADPEASGVTGTFDLEATPSVDGPPPELDGLEVSNKFGLSDLKFNKEKSIPLNFEKIVTKQVSFPIQNSSSKIEAQCTNCGAAGNTMIKLAAQGSLFPFKFSVSVEWSGSLQAGVDMEFNVPGTKSIGFNSSAITFVEVQIRPIVIAGVLNASSTFRLYGRTDYSVTEPTHVKLKLGANIPNFNVSLSSSEGLKADNITPILTSEFYRSVPGEGSIDLLLVPELTVDATVFGQNLGPATAVARVQISNSNTMREVDENGVCTKSDVKSVFEAKIMAKSKTIQVLAPSTILNRCVGGNSQ